MVSESTSYAGLVCDARDNLYSVTRHAEPGYCLQLSLHRKLAGQPWEDPRYLVVPYKPYYHVYYHKLTLEPVRQRLFLCCWAQTASLCLFRDELYAARYMWPDQEKAFLTGNPNLPIGSFDTIQPAKYEFYTAPPSELCVLLSEDQMTTWRLATTQDFHQAAGRLGSARERRAKPAGIVHLSELNRREAHVAERNYQFRQRLNVVHQPNRRDPAAQPNAGETEIAEGWRIALPSDASEYLEAVGKDLQDYLFVSMGVSALLVRADAEGARTIRLTTRDRWPEGGAALTTPRGYRLVVAGDGITICGHDERGVGQGCYYLEDLLNLRAGPFLEPLDVVRAPVFSPRMVHSGWGLDQFPDPHLNAIAHAGMDAVLVFVKGPDMTTTGYLDLNNLVDRAALHGLDVYLYSYLESRVHPGEPGAKAYYESTYGELVRSCPGAKGVIFVGESCEFPSKDPRTTGRLRLEPSPDGEPDSRPSPGWWPCTDYPEWLNLLKPILRQVNPELDIVFWTYNWGWAPEEDRLALIASLPQDITLQATFEMFENIEKEGIMTRCVDYTVSFAGPGTYFRSEAQAAHERGLRLYTMSNTAGLTWDIGVIPYDPVPFQWARRHEGLLAAHRDWGLVGLMDSHHYGWWPSVVNELAKWAFWEPATDPEEMAERLARRDFGPEGGQLAVAAWHDWSEAWLDYVPTNEDQYGPFRVGPSYPLLLEAEPELFPSAPFAHFGRDILSTHYSPHKPEDLPTEIALLERMARRWEEGLAKLEQAVALTPERKLPDAQRTLGLGQFIRLCLQTTINTKRWWLLKVALVSAEAPEQIRAVAAEMTELGEAEVANAAAAIPLVEADSRLGWEPSMEYMTDRAHLEWKIAQLRRVLDEELPAVCRRLAP